MHNIIIIVYIIRVNYLIVKSYSIQTKSQQTKPCLNFKLYQTDRQQWR